MCKNGVPDYPSSHAPAILPARPSSAIPFEDNVADTLRKTLDWQSVFIRLLMDDEALKTLISRVIISRFQGDSHLPRGGLDGCSVRDLIESAQSLFASEPVQLSLSGAFIVVGDLHGNIDDLLRVFDRFDYPPAQSFLFLGDYIDRGENSIETLLLLYALKVQFPKSIYLLRGNHECESISKTYGFKDECTAFFKKRRTYHRFCQSFAHLPIAAVVNDKFFCVHGGISPSIPYIDEIGEQIQKPLDNVNSSFAEDLLWSDPSSKICGFSDSPRHTGFLFGQDSLKQFLADNSLSLMVRAHQFCPSGVEFPIDGCLTVFSASDYCGLGNDGAVVLLRENGTYHVETFHVMAKERRRCLLPSWVVDRYWSLKSLEPEPFAEIVIEVDCDQPRLVC
jgi:diadenosine tetraphosphatase ApaH/serine/threonine PP2A family protein phosphatase